MNYCVTIVTIVTISFLVTGLQIQNVAILAKFRTEMANLAERKKLCMGKLTFYSEHFFDEGSDGSESAGKAQGYNSANHSNLASMNNVEQRINL